MDLEIELLPSYRDQVPPRYETDGSSGFDLRAIFAEDSIVLPPQSRTLIPTGIKVKIPPFHEGQIRPRSGLALKNGLTVLNTPGTIDSDYRGEIGVILANLSYVQKFIYFGDRIAQFVVVPVLRPRLVFTNVNLDTQRGEGGFGSTGEQ